jgi:CBS domain-containing protein
MDNQSQRIDTEQMENRKKFLSTIAPFQFLPKNEIITIVAKLTSQTHKKGSTLFLQEETAIDHILIVRSGRLERTIEEGGRKFVKATLEPGDIYGGISFLFNNCISTSTVRCIEEASVYNLDCEIFVRLCIEYPEFGLHFSRIIDQGKKRISSAASIETDRFEKEYLADSFLWKTIGDIVRAIPSCPIGTSIKQAAELLTASNRSAILILDEDSRPRGIVTDYDLRKKVIVDGRSPSDAVETIMSTHLIQLDVRSPVFEAVLTMMQNRVNHLAVSRDSRIEGIITERDLSHAGAHSPVLLAHEIQNARGLDELKKAYIKLPRMIQNVFLNGARASYLNSIITTITDAVLAKAVESAVKVLGPAPSQFAFLLFGSEGRKEQTLKTDQDNAIVYEDPAGKDEQKINEYFLNLGKYVCDRLDEIGQKHCKFEIMAKTRCGANHCPTGRRITADGSSVTIRTEFSRPAYFSIFDLVMEARNSWTVYTQPFLKIWPNGQAY